MSVTTLTCLRPLLMGTSWPPQFQRENDSVRCNCGNSTCRDYDLYLAREAGRLAVDEHAEDLRRLADS